MGTKSRNIELTNVEEEHLCWIHSNKFTTVELFHRKFLPNQSLRNAYYILSKYSGEEKDYLQTQQIAANNSAVYFLTVNALNILEIRNKVLLRNPGKVVKVNHNEKQHDLAVESIRISFEDNQDLKNIYWISDYEMRSGITLPIKEAYETGVLDIQRWREDWVNIQVKGRRTPDGYFKADLDGNRFDFVLEFENIPYSDRMVNRMIGYIRESFSEALRLVVSAETKNAIRMIRALQAKLPATEKDKWFVSDFERATTLPFKKVWHQVDQPIPR